MESKIIEMLYQEVPSENVLDALRGFLPGELRDYERRLETLLEYIERVKFEQNS